MKHTNPINICTRYIHILFVYISIELYKQDTRHLYTLAHVYA